MIRSSDSLFPLTMFFQYFLLAFILSIPAFAIFLAVRKISSRRVQFLLTLGAGIIACAWYSSVDPSNPGQQGLLLFLVGALAHPLLVLAPITLMQNYLHRVPVSYAVYFAAWASLCLAFMMAAFFQVGMAYEVQGRLGWTLVASILIDLVAATIVCSAVIGYDRMMGWGNPT